MKIKNKHRGWQRVLLLIVPYTFIVSLIIIIGAFILGMNPSNLDAEKTSIQKLGLIFFNLLGTFFVLHLFMKYVDKERFIELGFYAKNRLIDFLIGVGVGGVIMCLGYFLLLFLEEISFQKILFNFNEIVLSILYFLLVAIVEEVLIRGYILKNLMISFNKYVALIISSILFSLMHGFNPHINLLALTDLFLAGILLGVSYIHTKNLWFPIALHFSWNLFQTIFGFNVSGQDSYSIIEFNIKENNLLNGGDFGFEGSILSIIAQLITIIAIQIYFYRQRIN